MFKRALEQYVSVKRALPHQRNQPEGTDCGVIQHAGHVALIQTLLILTVAEPPVNTAMEAVADALSGRRFCGRFKTRDLNVYRDSPNPRPSPSRPLQMGQISCNRAESDIF